MCVVGEQTRSSGPRSPNIERWPCRLSVRAPVGLVVVLASAMRRVNWRVALNNKLKVVTGPGDDCRSLRVVKAARHTWSPSPSRRTRADSVEEANLESREEEGMS